MTRTTVSPTKDAAIGYDTPDNLPPIPVDELLTRFTMDDRDAVRSFLLTDPVLLFPLGATVPEIEAVFGENVPIFLEPVVNPETDDHPVLCALIQVRNSDVPTALKKLDELQRRWWYTARPRRGEILFFDVEIH